jgi:hypothetical protein
MVILAGQALNLAALHIADIQLAQRLINRTITRRREAGPANHLNIHTIRCHIHRKARCFLNLFFSFDMHRDGSDVQAIHSQTVELTCRPKDYFLAIRTPVKVGKVAL